MDERRDFPEWFEIFETGTWTSKEGIAREWTDKDLEEIAAAYDPNKFLAPIVIGHPDDNSPAYGWIESLKKEGNKLLAKPKELADEFKDWVKRGIYKKISMAIFPDMTLKHVGFLGGKAPALKGLKPVEFSGKKAGWTFEMDFSMEPWQQETVKSIFQRLRDWIIDKFGLEEADKVIQPWDLDSLKPEPESSAVVRAYCHTPLLSSDNNKKGGNHMDLKKFFSDLSVFITGAQKELIPDSPGSHFTEVDLAAAEKRGKEAAFAEAQKQVEVEAKAKKEAQDKLKEIETQKRKDEIASFCEAQCKEGKLTPALRKIIEPVMVVVSEISEPIEFSEGVKKTRLDGIKYFLTELPKVVTFKEIATDDKRPIPGSTAAEKLSILTREKMEKKNDLSYSLAFSEVQKENLDLAKEYELEIRPSKK